MTPLDRDTLCRRIAAGESFDYLLFYGHTPKGDGPGPFVFSQWYPAPFVVEGIDYPTAEHFMMAEKARLFADDAVRAAILSADGPDAAKRLGRAVHGFRDTIWEQHRFDIVVQGNVAKFSQSEPLRRYLLDTGERVLVEASPADRIWGIGLGAQHPDARDPSLWRGSNLLGFALMAARDAIRSQSSG